MATVYVAADPAQPGAAWAAFVNEPEHRKEIAKTTAGWIRRGANVMLVSPEEARDMLAKWVRPEKRPARSLPLFDRDETRTSNHIGL